MSLNKMIDNLYEFCNKQSGCIGCELEDNGHCRFHKMNDEEIIKAYKKIFDKNRSYTDEKVNHPVHYQGKNECIDVMVAMFGKEAVKHFCMCNAYKYRFRADMKNGAEDIEKAEWYESKLIELGGVDNEKN